MSPPRLVRLSDRPRARACPALPRALSSAPPEPRSRLPPRAKGLAHERLHAALATLRWAMVDMCAPVAAERMRGAWFGAVREFYSVPLVKFNIRATWHLAFLALI